MHRNAHTSWLGAGSQQVHNIQMVSNVVEDLQLSHQSFVFAGCSSLWWTKSRQVAHMILHTAVFSVGELHTLHLVPLSILTATVPQLRELFIPIADACITLPNAPRPRGLPVRKRPRAVGNRVVFMSQIKQLNNFINYYYHPSWM